MTIDVIIPAYNCAATLGRTLASLAAQTDDDFVVTVVDDGSTESILPVIDKWRFTLKDLRVIQKPNSGAGMARQFGIDHTNGEYITFVDADDVLMPYAVEVFKLIVENNPDLNVLNSAFLQQGIEDGKHSYVKLDRGFTWMHGKLYRRAFLEQYSIRNDPRFTLWADDGYFNSMCSELTPLVMNELPMYVWTQTDGSLTRKREDSGREELKTLIDAMIASAEHTLRYKTSVGHLFNTLNNIRQLIADYGGELSPEELAAYRKLQKLYEDHGVKPEEKPKKRRLFAK